jgi:hypothetical protein
MFGASLGPGHGQAMFVVLFFGSNGEMKMRFLREFNGIWGLNGIFHGVLMGISWYLGGI